ncbi:bifunctional riboflavin kinase/FAD synthetase [Aliikangiella sp. IMCC44653]
MKLIRGLINLQQQSQSCVATIGNFDGVHLGHQAIVAKVIAKAKALGIPSCVLIFEPHPKEFFMGDACPPRLTCFKEKYLYLKSLGIDQLVVLQFNQSLRQMEAREFVSNVLIGRLKIAHLVVGDDFHFGHQRKGNFQLLDEMSQGQYTLEPTPSILVDKQRVSSSLIRETLSQHNLSKAKRLFGRRYRICGRVGYGNQVGRTIDFPTANVCLKRIRPALHGVYLVKCYWQSNGNTWQAWGAANCGLNPTLKNKKYRLEVHLLGVSPALYGIELAVDFYQLLREEKKFADLDQLKQQISQDINYAKQLIAEKNI